MNLNQNHTWSVVSGAGQRLTTVTAPDEETAKDEARKALARPGRELSYQLWASGGRQVVRS